jgi:hypothetical protein
MEGRNCYYVPVSGKLQGSSGAVFALPYFRITLLLIIAPGKIAMQRSEVSSDSRLFFSLPRYTMTKKLSL